MNKKEQRQQLLIEVIKDTWIVNRSGILSYLRWKNIQATERTIQRDIQELSFLISSDGNWKNVKYLISKEKKIHLPIDIEWYFLPWYKKRDVFNSFNFDVFDRLRWDIFSQSEMKTLELLHQKFISNISRYESQTIINKEYERIMIEFSWKSSVIEWNTYELLNTEALIKENIADATKTKEETKMILNHKDAFNESIQNREKFLDLKINDIEYLHTLLTKWLWIWANIRKEWVWITWTLYRPLDNQFQIKEAIEKMIMLINTKDNFFEKSFLSLVMLSYIQAFEDWNKRTSRTVSNAILLAHGSIPLSYRIVDVVEYKKACILFYEQNNISYFKKIFIEQIEDAVNNYFV